MNKNERTLTPSRIILALLAVLALAAGTFLLYSYTMVSLALVFVPLAVALVGGVVIVIVKPKLFDLAIVLALVASAVNGLNVIVVNFFQVL